MQPRLSGPLLRRLQFATSLGRGRVIDATLDPESKILRVEVNHAPTPALTCAPVFQSVKTADRGVFKVATDERALPSDEDGRSTTLDRLEHDAFLTSDPSLPLLNPLKGDQPPGALQ